MSATISDWGFRVAECAQCHGLARISPEHETALVRLPGLVVFLCPKCAAEQNANKPAKQ